MKTLLCKDRRVLMAAALIALVAADRIAAWWTGVDGWLGGPAGAAPLLLWGFGHCDTLDGPVVNVARRALDAGNVNLVLPWVRKDDEEEIREAFGHALGVRALGAEAKALADQHFFETLVRIHRAGEGAPYTGLKPAGRDLGPAVPAADHAVKNGAIDKVERLLIEAVRSGLHEHFHRVLGRRDFEPNNVAAGRRYVEAYVPYIHYVEGLWQAATKADHQHHHSEAEHT